MPIIRFYPRRGADPGAGACRRHTHPGVGRRHKTPIAPAAPPVPNLPRLRALALFGRRPPQRVEGVVMPASKNLVWGLLVSRREWRGWCVLFFPHQHSFSAVKSPFSPPPRPPAPPPPPAPRQAR